MFGLVVNLVESQSVTVFWLKLQYETSRKSQHHLDFVKLTVNPTMQVERVSVWFRDDEIDFVKLILVVK